MNNNDKLYLVRLQGLYSSAGSTNYGSSYVVAKSPNEAYAKVVTFLEENDIGFEADREMEYIELVAEDARYPDCKTMLFT